MKRRATASSTVAKARPRKAKRRRSAHRVEPRPPSDASLREQLDQSRRELKEALEHQAATREVLDLISRTPTNVQPVFDAIIESAVRLCDAVFGVVWRYDGELLHYAASHNFTPDVLDQISKIYPKRPDRSIAAGRAILHGRIAHVPDMLADPEYGHDLALAGNWRATVAVPMLHEGKVVGAVSIGKAETGPFSPRQIQLLTTFAAQAVIAIENARLLSELRESLEQQTATSEVVKVVSSSPGDLQPVFEAMLANATRLSEAKFGVLYRTEGDAFRTVALYSAPLAYAEERRRSPIVRPHPESALGRVLATKRTVQITDVLKQPHYFDAPSGYTAPLLPKLAGARTVLAVPKCKDNDLVGIIAIYRQEVRPFTDKQIELVTNFAAQAVIAIENTRLLNELRQRTDALTESLEQQTATSEVLKVISSSQGELQPVFDAILANATQICEAEFGNLTLYDGEMFRRVVLYNAPAAWAADLHDPRRTREQAPLLYRLADTRAIVHIADVFAEAPGETIHKFTGARSLVIVPMFKGEELAGSIGIYRQEVRPFSEKQIALLKSFADQAVIAIENARLLSELRESLEQQTATSEVLKVI